METTIWWSQCSVVRDCSSVGSAKGRTIQTA
jgi:hypothetical protein